MAATTSPEDGGQTPGTPAKHKLRLKNLIGKGAFGSIYKGVLDGEVVAVKTLSQNRNQESQQQNDAYLDDQMFFREAEMLKACQHRRIIGFRHLLRMPPADSKSKEPVWALVMEYAKNGNLGQRIAQQMTQPGRSSYTNMQAMSWALDIASSLEYLHMRVPAVFHRDVKSANIMLAAEEGAEVAKLSDFGLHVTADDSKHRTLQSSGYSSSVAGGGATSNALLRSSSSTASRVQDSSVRTNSSSNSSGLVTPAGLPPPALAAAPPAAAGDGRSLNDIYSEVHDSGGRRTYVQQQPAAAAATAGAIAQATCNLVAHRNSFRRANHHPPGEALPRLANSSGTVGFGSFSDPESAADANARLFAHMRSVVDGSSAGGSMSSIVTDGTWGRTETVISGTDTAGSDCTDDTAGSIFKEVETVFNMTGRTGSCLYMAPEVYQAKQYNEKSDVFSFGVVLYELMARVLVVFTELPTNSDDPDIPQLYAEKVAGGYRPSRPKTKYMTDDIWALISACWHQDPLLRPHMSEVVAVLSKAVTDEAARQLTSRSSRTSFSFSGRRTSMQLQAPTAAAAGAARRAASISGPPGGGAWGANGFARRSAPLQSVGVPGCEDGAAGSDPDTNKAAARVPAIDEDCCDDVTGNNELIASTTCADNTAAAAAADACGDNNADAAAGTTAQTANAGPQVPPAASQGCCVIC